MSYRQRRTGVAPPISLGMLGAAGSQCDRCGKQTLATIMSMFNTDTLCMQCKEEEKRHPDYEKAREAEGKAVLAGDHNFPGIGWPRPEQHFQPADHKQDALFLLGRDVPNYCRHCSRPWMDHVNGVCPKEGS